MSSGQRKRPGGAADSGPARKRGRLQRSSTGGTSQAEPIELVESGTAALEPEVIDLTGEEEVIDLTGEDIIDLTGEEDVIDLTGDSSEFEVITISDDESVVDINENQQQPHLSMASENSAEPLERDEDQRDTDEDWEVYDFDLPYWSDEDSEDRVQNQQQPHLSSAAGNSAEPLERDDEERRDTDDDWLLYDFDLPYWSDEDSEDRLQNHQQPHVSSAAENSAESLERHDEEEPRDVDGDWEVYDFDLPYWSDEDSEDRVQNQQQPHVYSAEENSVEPLERDDEERRDTDDYWEVYDFDPPYWSDEDSELLEVHEEERSNLRVNSHDQVDGSGNGRGANEAPVAASAPAEQGAEEEDTQSSDSVPLPAQQGVVIRCPICMDYYSEIMRRGRHLMSTMCGHVFCSRCLPLALETAHTCPACRENLSRELYHPIYL